MAQAATESKFHGSYTAALVSCLSVQSLQSLVFPISSFVKAARPSSDR